MSDEELIIGLQKGDEKVYETIFLNYYSPLCEYASQYVIDSEAEELVSDLMLYIWEKRKELLIYKSLKSYLFTAVKFRCLNALKKDSYHQQVHSELYDKLKEQFENPDYYIIGEYPDVFSYFNLFFIFPQTVISSRFFIFKYNLRNNSYIFQYLI